MFWCILWVFLVYSITLVKNLSEMNTVIFYYVIQYNRKWKWEIGNEDFLLQFAIRPGDCSATSGARRSKAETRGLQVKPGELTTPTQGCKQALYISVLL